jgi:hypothetical protein
MNNISSLVQSQFPQFVQDDYPALIAFIEAYYKYLEVEKNPQDILSNLIAYADIDRTLDEFVSKFEKTYLNGLPQTVQGDKRTFMKHVSDLYNTKGTEESFRLLFRLLFNEEIEIAYPKQQMLRLSDGKWSQRVSVKVILDGGTDTTNVINKKIKIWTNNGVINTYVKDFAQQADGVYEIFIDKTFGIDVQPGNRVTGMNFGATTLPTTTTMLITSPGGGFHVGQVFDVSSVLGSGTKIKVTKIDANGGIKRAAFIQFGTGYEADFMVQFASAARKSGALDPFQAYTNGFIENVLVTKVTYFASDYVSIDYSGQVVGSSYTDDYRPDNAQAATTPPAVIQFYLGALCIYRGEYLSADGFLSDVNVIQDGYLYQDFSYVIKSKQKIQDYASAVKKLCHPAGTLMFGEMSLEADVDVGVTYEYFKVLAEQLRFTDSVTSSDSFTFITGKALFDALTGSQEAVSFAVAKPIADGLAGSFDTLAFLTGKALIDSLAGSDDSNISFETDKSLTDSLAGSQEDLAFVTGKVLADSLAGSVDAPSFATGKYFNNPSTQYVTPGAPVVMGTGDGSNKFFQMANELNVLNQIMASTVYVQDWQGTVAQYPVPRTNLFLQSAALSSSTWLQTRVASLTAVTGPDGNATSAMRVAANSSGTGYLYQSINFTNGVPVEVTVYAKANTGSKPWISSITQAGTVQFDLVAGTVTSTTGIASGGVIVAVGGGWYRLSAIFTPTATGSNQITPMMSGVASTAIDFYGPMASVVQSGVDQMSAFIPTLSSTVTYTDYTQSGDGNTDVTFVAAPSVGATVSWAGMYAVIGDYGTSIDSTYSFITGKNLADSLAGSTESWTFVTGKALADSLAGSTELVSFLTARPLTDSLSGSDDSGIALNTSKPFSDSLAGSDDTGISAYLFNYSDVTYFADTSYVGTQLM